MIHLLTKQTTLNDFAALPKSTRAEFRLQIQALLRDRLDEARQCSVKVSDVITHLPVSIGDFSDYSASINHHLNASEAMMGNRGLPPSFLHFPVGYTGRSASIIVSGTDIRRPHGQFRRADKVVYEPSEAVDYELEVGCIVGPASKQGYPVTMDEADDHIFGFVLVNDWSCKCNVSR